MQHRALFIALIAALFLPGLAMAAGGESPHLLDFTSAAYGIIALAVFVVAYLLVIGEESLHLRKSKPVIVAAGIIWLLTALAYRTQGDVHTPGAMVRHNLLEYAELFLFLLSAMTYINTMADRDVFRALRSWLISRGFTYRAVFWITGSLAFMISPIADNLTTALLMAAVALAVGAGNKNFVTLCCINIVVAANAGGAFSPFGDITTLMVWQKGVVQFHEFLALMIPSIVNWLVPAVIMSCVVTSGSPPAIGETSVKIKRGGGVVIGLFLVTIAMAVSAHNFLHLPPVLGMMTGLGLLKFFGYYLKQHGDNGAGFNHSGDLAVASDIPGDEHVTTGKFDIFKSIEQAEWDTLMFFYGVILCVGGLGALGYLGLASQFMYVDLGPTWANMLVGLLSAIIDNIPVMFAVLSMMPDMSHGQWLLVTLTAGCGGSLLSIGSAAGVALMGQARGVYTFYGHLKWSWAIALGYAASIWVHFLINGELI
ncbi:MAG: sodium:proton antiporter NhaD [Gammaproteobacteria bacterium]|nr:sodium:proton antiporter NhaD [Gammaproteobacteria bacterium]